MLSHDRRERLSKRRRDRATENTLGIAYREKALNWPRTTPVNAAIVSDRTETIQATAEWARDEIGSLSEQVLWLRLAANWFCQSNELMSQARLGP